LGNKTWDVTYESFKALFSQHTNKQVIVPDILESMSKMSHQEKSSWSYDELVTLGTSVSPKIKNGNSSNISVIFLNGLYEGNSSILGIHLTGYPFSFVFKDVVKSVGGDDTTQKYVEQSTVVHEVGHTIGLVNAGVPMTAFHEDSEHSHDTTNTKGVMYWSVESTSNIISFLADIIAGKKLNLFEAQSLSDAGNFHP
jgi:hypothetical protein